MSETHVPQLVAHRGQLQHYPENTWLGLEAAIRAGACWLEFDIQMCADGQFVLLHDADFARTGKNPVSVFETGTRQLQGISVHEPDRLGDRFAPLAVSSLDSVLQHLSGFPDIRAMVEIKEESLAHWGMEAVTAALLDKLVPYRSQCVLISYNHPALCYVQSHSSIQTGWVLTRYDQNHLNLAQSLNPQFLICNADKIPAHENPWPGNWQWMLYDIIDPDTALRWASRGVALIETRDIAAMLKHPRLASKACRHGL